MISPEKQKETYCEHCGAVAKCCLTRKVGEDKEIWICQFCDPLISVDSCSYGTHLILLTINTAANIIYNLLDHSLKVIGEGLESKKEGT